MKVFKFGGSSVGNAQRIKKVADIIIDSFVPGEGLSVVFSAMQGVTDSILKISSLAESGELKYKEEFEIIKKRHFDTVDELFEIKPAELYNELNNHFTEFDNLLYGIFILHELTDKTKDKLLSYGEILSNSIIAKYLEYKGAPGEFVNAVHIIKTNNQFNRAKVNFDLTNKLITEKLSDNNKIYVITGFISSTENGDITTLGRGGSDYTAAIIGAAVETDEIVIWTDVDGILTADPRRVNEVRTIKAVTYEEAIELSYFGAKVIHPPTMLPALSKKIKIRIKNTFNPDFKGTIIIERQASVRFTVKGISSIDNVSIIRVRGGGMRGIDRTTSRIFDTLGNADISILLITQGSSGNSISIAVYPEQAEEASRLLNNEFKYELLQKELEEVIVLNNHSLIAVVGEDMIDTPGVSGKVFQALGKNGINVIAIAQGSSQLNISVVIKQNQLVKALNVLHDGLELSNEKILNLFMIGPGLVGSALLEKIDATKEKLLNEKNVKIKLIGLANSKKMLFEPSGINCANWKDELFDKGIPVVKDEYLHTMYAMDLANTIFVDCTASPFMTDKYEDILSKSISVVTPNKIANTYDMNFYNSLRQTAAKHNVEFRYSTNVGAGLPFISVINDRKKSADKIISIEAVLSGSLSFIFNNFTADKGFYDVVNEARDLGYTEPDPRDDLAGTDAGRKLLILLREAGMSLELKNINIESLVPEEASKDKMDVGQYLEYLKSSQDKINKLRDEALNENKKLCYIASYRDSKAKVKIEKINSAHPFYNLTGSENVMSVYTETYSDLPVVIRGSGAGAKVTSAGVFSDIIRIANYLGYKDGKN